MDSEDQTAAYAGADFEEPNLLFVLGFVDGFGKDGGGEAAVDLGWGPAEITTRFARLYPGCRVTGADAGANMLRLAAAAVQGSGLAQRVSLARCRLPDLNELSPPYDAIISNSLLHHLPEGATLWRAVRDLGRTGTRVMVMDLRRPASRDAAREIVAQYSGDEPEVLRQDFENSLCAAFTPGEIAAQLHAAGLDELSVEEPSDRHVLISGELI